jgi:hypothetical protein
MYGISSSWLIVLLPMPVIIHSPAILSARPFDAELEPECAFVDVVATDAVCFFEVEDVAVDNDEQLASESEAMAIAAAYVVYLLFIDNCFCVSYKL